MQANHFSEDADIRQNLEDLLDEEFPEEAFNKINSYLDSFGNFKDISNPENIQLELTKIFEFLNLLNNIFPESTDDVTKYSLLEEDSEFRISRIAVFGSKREALSKISTIQEKLCDKYLNLKRLLSESHYSESSIVGLLERNWELIFINFYPFVPSPPLESNTSDDVNYKTKTLYPNPKKFNIARAEKRDELSAFLKEFNGEIRVEDIADMFKVMTEYLFFWEVSIFQKWFGK